jgi:hypothetical protein
MIDVACGSEGRCCSPLLPKQAAYGTPVKCALGVYIDANRTESSHVLFSLGP